MNENTPVTKPETRSLKSPGRTHTSCFLWKPDATRALPGAPASSGHLAEFVVVTNACPISDEAHLLNMVESPPTLKMMAEMLNACPLTADHFRMAVGIAGTFALWTLSPEGNHWIVIPRGYDGPKGSLAVRRDSENPCLNLVSGLASQILGRSIPADTVLSCGLHTTHGDFTVYAIGVPVRCDVCGHEIGEGAGFSLSARYVVSSPRYWRMRYEHNRARWAEAGVSTFDEYRANRSITDSEVTLILGLGSAWLVCDACVVNFAADREAARAFAAAWWKNRAVQIPADWVATPSDVNMG